MRRSYGFLRLIGGALGALTAFAPGRAEAFDNDWHVGAKGGLAVLDGKDLGPAVGIHGAYELSDMFDAELELTGSRNSDATGAQTQIFGATAGVAYKIDILQLVPYVGALGGYYDYMQAPGPHGESGSEFGMAIQVGLDYLLTRNVALSFDFRTHLSFHDGFTSAYMPLQTFLLGAEYRWGL